MTLRHSRRLGTVGKLLIDSLSNASVRRGERGFTLIELIMTIVLVGIIGGIIGALLLGGTQAFVAEDTKASLTTQGRLAVERMVRDIRLVRSRTAGDIPTMTAATLNFIDTSGNAIAYTSGGGSITRNGVVLAAAPTANLAFSYFQQDGTPAASAAQVWVIQVDLTFGGTNDSQDFRVRIHPRNF
ncbi:MAG: prepilin-type N-terminal cleavage/methylation domain-containing protein [Nitrospirota bacterium]